MIDSSFQNQGGISIPPTGISAKTSIFPLRGVNLSGMEFSGYVFQPNQQEATYYSSIGAKIIRLPFTWERLQPTLGGDLDPTNLGYLQNAVSYVTSAGMYALIDCHNFGAYGGNLINSTRGPTTAQFVDFWLKLNAVFNSNDHVFYDQMNEPAGISAAAMGVINQALVTALRNAGYNRYIFLESGGSYSAAGMFQWDAGTAATALVDPLNKLVFEVHGYFDSDNSGTHTTAMDGAADSMLLGCTQFARKNNLKVFLGEFGFANNTNMLAEAQRALEIMKNNQDVWVGWTTWGGGHAWGGYMYALNPSSYNPLTERAQTILLKGYFSDSAFLLDFRGGALPEDCSFVRNTGATRFNASGIMENVTNNTPRFDYDPSTLELRGLFIEPSATNLIPYSTINSSGLGWTQGITTLTFGGTISGPDGTQSLRSILDTTAVSDHDTAFSLVNVTVGLPYTFSCIACAGAQTILQITGGFSAFGTNNYVNFDLKNGVVGSTGSAVVSASIQDLGGGLYRCSVVFTATGSNAIIYLTLTNNNLSAVRLPTYLGTGTGVYVGCCALEQGTHSSSTIMTSGSAATRAADQLSFNIPSGVNKLRYTFDNLSTQDVDVTNGSYTVPTNLNRPWIKNIQGF